MTSRSGEPGRGLQSSALDNASAHGYSVMQAVAAFALAQHQAEEAAEDGGAWREPGDVVAGVAPAHTTESRSFVVLSKTS